LALGVLPQGVYIVLLSKVEQDIQAIFFILLLYFLLMRFRLLDVNAILVGQVFDGFYKADPFYLSYKGDGIAGSITSKALLEAFGRRDRKGGSFFLMKRTACP
jgi:hypothetical protein